MPVIFKLRISDTPLLAFAACLRCDNAENRWLVKKEKGSVDYFDDPYYFRAPFSPSNLLTLLWIKSIFATETSPKSW